MTAREQSGRSPGAPEDPARPPSTVPSGNRQPADGEAPVAGDAAEPAGDQDPAVEAERIEQTDRVRSPEAVESEEAGAEAPPGDGAHPEPDATDPLARAEAQRDEYLALAQRIQADFDNYRKRAARDVAVAGSRAKAELVRAMLPAVDNLERALASAGDGEATLAEGVRLVHSELIGALERSGVASIDPEGEPFDPNVHEALSTRAENGAEAGTVLDVVQKGYRLDESVLRPARVVVAA